MGTTNEGWWAAADGDPSREGHAAGSAAGQGAGQGEPTPSGDAGQPNEPGPQGQPAPGYVSYPWYAGQPQQQPTQQYPAQQGPTQQYPAQPYPGQQGYPHQYPSQQYPGQQYPGQQYPGQQYAGQQYPGQQHAGQQYPGQQHAGQYPYAGQQYGWPAHPGYHRPPRRHHWHVGPAGGLAVALLTAVAAVGAGHVLWPSGSSTFGGSISGDDGGSGAPGSNGSGGSGSSGGSSSVGNGPTDAAQIARNVNPGVVDINTTLGYRNAQAAGTGMVLTSSGRVLTNNHVISGATDIRVTAVGNGRTYKAKVVGYSRANDVAVLQLEGAGGLRTVTTGDSDRVSVGAGVVAIGNKGGTGGTPSYAGGTVTALGQSISATDSSDGSTERLTNLIATDADIRPGDSGGPLVDTKGRVIGIDTAATAGFQFSQGSTQGFAIPINRALALARQIVRGEASAAVHIGPTALLGVNLQSGQGSGGMDPLDPFGGGSTQGASVTEVVEGGPAEKAGLAAGDTITSLDGHPITSVDDVTSVMTRLHPGDRVSVGYVDSAGQQQTTHARLVEGPPQ